MEKIRNRILRATLEEFKSQFSINNKDSFKIFEKFSNYTIVSKSDPDAFSDLSNLDFVDVDAGGTFGIDAFALIVNNTIIKTEDDLALQRKSKHLDVEFIFLQEKISDTFKIGDILKTISSVKLILNGENPQKNDDVKEVIDLINKIYLTENARLFSPKKPRCNIYFCNAGKKPVDETLIASILKEEEDLNKIYDDVENFKIHLLGCDDLISIYKEVENTNIVSFNFDRRIECVRTEQANQSYIGYLPISEFLKIISMESGEIKNSIFYENVRDFQGMDKVVNSEINETINSEDMYKNFILLNNGITIIAKNLKNVISSDYEMSDYYIVNGCQTSNIIFMNREKIKDKSDFFVPVKIIHTSDGEFISKIVKSTNRQNKIPEEAFLSLEEFHKKLQDYYKIVTIENFGKIYYERRSREFSNSPDVLERSRVVTLHSQIRFFTAVMYGAPYLPSTRNPASMLKDYDFFKEGDFFSPYYLSSAIMIFFIDLISKGEIDEKYKIARYWVGWLFKIIAFDSISNYKLNSRIIDSSCEKIIEEMKDREKIKKTFIRACDLFDEMKNEYEKHMKNHYRKKDLVKMKEFSNFIRSNIHKYIGESNTYKLL